MSKYRTAMGKTLDMGILRSRNQNVRAVGNMNVDAAGNTLDSNNEVISDSAKRVNQVYGKTTVNPGAAPRGRALPPDARNPQPGGPMPAVQPPPQAHPQPPVHHLSPLQRKLQAEQTAKAEAASPPESVQFVPPPSPTPVVAPARPATPIDRHGPQPDGEVRPTAPAATPIPVAAEPLFSGDGGPSQAELEQLTEWDEELPVEKAEPPPPPPQSGKARRR